MVARGRRHQVDLPAGLSDSGCERHNEQTFVNPIAAAFNGEGTAEKTTQAAGWKRACCCALTLHRGVAREGGVGGVAVASTTAVVLDVVDGPVAVLQGVRDLVVAAGIRNARCFRR